VYEHLPVQVDRRAKRGKPEKEPKEEGQILKLNDDSIYEEYYLPDMPMCNFVDTNSSVCLQGVVRDNL